MGSKYMYMVSASGKRVRLFGEDVSKYIEVDSGRLIRLGLITSIHPKDLGEGVTIYCNKLHIVKVKNDKLEIEIPSKDYLRLINAIERRVSDLRANEMPEDKIMSCDEFIENHFNKIHSSIFILPSGQVRYRTKADDMNDVQKFLDENAYVWMEPNMVRYPDCTLTKEQRNTLGEIKMRDIL